MSTVTGESPKSSLSCPVISASVVIDQLDGKGSVLRSARHPAAELSLCRNEQRDLALLVATARGHQMKIFLKEVTLHRRFLREGKATVVVRGQQLRVLISNAPPAQLLTFLRVLSAKLALQPGETRPASVRDRLLRPPGDRRLDEISPLTAEQLGKLQQSGQKTGQQGQTPLTARDPNVPVTAARSGKRPAVLASGAENQVRDECSEYLGTGYVTKRRLVTEMLEGGKSSSRSVVQQLYVCLDVMLTTKIKV